MSEVRKVKWLPFGGTGVMLFGHIFLLDGMTPILDKFITLHEERHVQQYNENHKLWFYVLYGIELLKHGYTGNQFEIDADLYARENLRKEA